MERYKIIAVDHDRAILDLIEEMLLSEGYDVQSYLENSVDVERIQQARPDLVIIDLRRMDANITLLLLKRLRRHPATSAVPVIVSSTDRHLLCELDVPLRHLGCLTIVKPFEIDEFLDCIHQAIVSHWYFPYI